MTWKTELKLTDLDTGTRIEITCRRCNLTRYEGAADLLTNTTLRHAYLDEVETTLSCSNRFCRGPVRLALIHDNKTEGFVGGMP